MKQAVVGWVEADSITNLGIIGPQLIESLPNPNCLQPPQSREPNEYLMSSSYQWESIPRHPYSLSLRYMLVEALIWANVLLNQSTEVKVFQRWRRWTGRKGKRE